MKEKESLSEKKSKELKMKEERKGEITGPEGIWNPKTALGKKVKEGIITDIDDIFNQGEKILEPEIVNTLLPDLEEDLLLIGQAKGKFGGGQRRIFRQTQKKTREGNKIQFTTCAVVGNKNGYVGVGTGKSKETVPARDKSKRKARLNIMRIRRGCGSWESDAREPTSVPFAVEGKCGSVKIKLMPAPRGKGLCIEKECAKILEFAGIKDIWSKTQGQTKVKLNLIYALIDALKKLSEVKIKPEDVQKLGIVEGKMKGEEEKVEEVKEVNEGKEEPVVKPTVPPPTAHPQKEASVETPEDAEEEPIVEEPTLPAPNHPPSDEVIEEPKEVEEKAEEEVEEKND